MPARSTAIHLRPVRSHGGGEGGEGQGEGPGRDWAGLAHTSLVGGLRLSFISRHCNQQQDPVSVRLESLLFLSASYLVSEDPQGAGAG